MARVFLSHSSRDREEAASMRTWLLEQGFEAPFLDYDKHSGIAPGDNWEQRLYRELEISQAILLLLTANWQASKWCFAEFTQARAMGKTVLPVIAGPLDGEGTSFAADLQSVNLLEHRQDSLERLRLKLAEISMTSQGGMPWDTHRSPYPGLASLDQDDAAIYFGREPETRQVIERLTARRSFGGAAIVVVLGASGAGKSSLLRAGVVPRLRCSGREWIVPPPFRPQRRPLDSLALSLNQALGFPIPWQVLRNRILHALNNGTQYSLLDQLANDLRASAASNQGSILLAIDQGEELYLQAEPEERSLFLHMLNTALSSDLPYIGVMTLRSDALGWLQAEERLNLYLDQISLAPMPVERLEDVILGPARVAALRVDAGLVHQIQCDASSGDALPMLAFTLRELYDRSAPHHNLTASAYEALADPQLGLTPLENSIRSAADRALVNQQPDAAQLQALRQAFIPKMVRIDDSGNYARQAAFLDDLPPSSWSLLEALVQARVLILRQEKGERIIEVAHESLLRKWPLLRSWLDEARQLLLDLANLTTAQREWSEAHASDKTRLLLSGLKLNRARLLLQEHAQEFSPEVTAFVQASIAREDQETMSLNARRQRVLASLASLSVLAMFTGAAALWQLRQARLAQLQDFKSTAAALLEKDPLDAVFNALAGMEDMNLAMPLLKHNDHHLLGVLALGLARNSAVFRVPLQIANPTSLLRLEDSSILVADRGGRFRRLLPGAQRSVSLSESHPGTSALARGSSGVWYSASRDGSLRRWIGSVSLGPALRGGQQHVVSLAALPHGLTVTGALDGSLRWWRHGDPIGPIRSTQLGSIWALQPLADGSVLVAGDSGLIQRWLPSGPVSAAFPSGQGSVRCLSVLADGTWISGGEDGTVRPWRNGRPLAPIGPRAFGSIVALSAWGRGGLAWSVDSGGLVLWRDGHPPSTVQVLGSGPLRALERGDAGLVLSLGVDGTVGGWRWPKPPAWVTDTGQRSVHALLVQKDGTLVSGGWDGTLHFWRGLQPLPGALATHQGPLRILLQLDNGALMVGGLDATLQIWEDGQPRGKRISTAQVGLRSLLVLRNGDLISGGFDGRIRRWRKFKEVPPVLLNGDLPVVSLAEMENGDILTGDAHGIVRRLRWPHWQGQGIQTGQRLILSIQPISSHEWLTAGRDGTLKHWRDGALVGPPLRIESEEASWRLVRVPSGDLVVSSGSHGYLFKLIPPLLAVKIACEELRGLPELHTPSKSAHQAAARLCRKIRSG